MSVSASKPVYTVSARELVDFVWRQGDLGGARQFVGSDRALTGIRGHQKIQRARPAGYQTEIPIEHRVEADEFTLQIRGRIDGLLITGQGAVLEGYRQLFPDGWNPARVRNTRQIGEAIFQFWIASPAEPLPQELASGP